MVLDLLLMVLAIILGIGFYTGKTDWILIHYGCAPKSAKDEMNGKLILTIAWASMLIITMLLGINVLFQTSYIRFLVYKFRWASLFIFIGMYIITFIISQKKWISKQFRKLSKTSNSNNITNDTSEIIIEPKIEKTNKVEYKTPKKKKKKHSGDTHNTKSKNQRIQEALKGRH